MTDLVWTATGSKGLASLWGNCGAADNEWCRLQAVTPASGVRPASLVDNPDRNGPPLMFEFGVKFGDVLPGMSDQRCLVSGPPRLWAKEGDEQWYRWWTCQPADWVGAYPKWDQLATPSATSTGGTGMEFHHEPAGGGVETGSAPIYTGASATELWLGLVDQSTGTFWKKFSLAPLVRGHSYEWILHVKWSPDPAVGFLELWLDGVNAIPKFSTHTMYPNTKIYPLAGIYRNLHIGDPALLWPAGTPKAGAPVYPKGDGEPQSQMLGGFALGKTLASVLGSDWGTKMPQLATTSLPQPALDGLALLVSLNGLLRGVDGPLADGIAAATKLRGDLALMSANITTLLNKGPWQA